MPSISFNQTLMTSIDHTMICTSVYRLYNITFMQTETSSKGTIIFV